MQDLIGFVQHYDWGGKNFIPDLIGAENTQNLPFAEWWLGTHQKGPSKIKDNSPESLERYLKRRPEALGPIIRERYKGKLPFLLKVLDVSDMLSIQAHPNRAEAERGFALEEEKGIPIDAPNRVFRDPNPKPEMMLALTEFWLLHGFKSTQEIMGTLSEVPEFRELVPKELDIASLYSGIMQMPQHKVNAILRPLEQRLLKLKFSDKGQPEYWAKKALTTFKRQNGDIDRGIFSIFLMNIVRMVPGEAIFQQAGVLHAYLEGVNVELMVNSDNVFRGGLTAKHIDVQALLDHIHYDAVIPRITRGEKKDAIETVFPSAFPEFELAVWELETSQNKTYSNPDSLALFLVLEGSVVANEQIRARGAAFLLEAGEALKLTNESASKAVIVKAYVPS